MARVFKRAAARRDLVNHFVYLAENAGDDVAERFLLSAEASFLALARHPAMGSPIMLHTSELSRFRKWRVKNFENVLIFYLARPGGISIVRVLHATRDWWSLLGIEPT